MRCLLLQVGIGTEGMLRRMDNTGGIVPLGKPPAIKVMIVERHPAVRRALTKRLDDSTQLDVVDAVGDLGTALEHIRMLAAPGGAGRAPDAIILGLESGTDEQLFATLDEVRKLADCDATIVVLAPYADEVERLLMLQAGVKRYLLKHIDSPRLIHEIEAAVDANTAISH
jgi:DNA-binding NarL/FixJ family response regulator